MAFSPGGSGSGSGSGRRGRLEAGMLAEINVTPFVDVLLVLLIIFMLTAHVMESGIEVDVPAVKTTKETTKDLPIVTITKEGLFYLGEKEININLLAPTIQQHYGKAQTVYIRADKAAPWDLVAQVMAELGAAKIGISAVTKPEDITRKRR